MSIFKKLKDGTFERTDSRQEKTILNKEELEKNKKFLEEKIKDDQSQLDFVNENLKGINKLK